MSNISKAAVHASAAVFDDAAVFDPRADNSYPIAEVSEPSDRHL